MKNKCLAYHPLVVVNHFTVNVRVMGESVGKRSHLKIGIFGKSSFRKRHEETQGTVAYGFLIAVGKTVRLLAAAYAKYFVIRIVLIEIVINVVFAENQSAAFTNLYCGYGAYRLTVLS